jgi:hypothetical protein
VSAGGVRGVELFDGRERSVIVYVCLLVVFWFVRVSVVCLCALCNLWPVGEPCFEQIEVLYTGLQGYWVPCCTGVF